MLSKMSRYGISMGTILEFLLLFFSLWLGNCYMLIYKNGLEKNYRTNYEESRKTINIEKLELSSLQRTSDHTSKTVTWV